MVQSFQRCARFHDAQRPRLPRRLENSAWTELNVTRLSDAGFLGFFRSKIDAALERYNRDIDLGIPIPNSPKTADLILKRYRPGQYRAVRAAFRCDLREGAIATWCFSGT